jgi:hypothetical protein
MGSVDDAEFRSLLEQVRELHRLADDLARSTIWIHANVRARLNWETDPPPLPLPERELADKVVEVLERPQLSSSQARKLQRAFFDR